MKLKLLLVTIALIFLFSIQIGCGHVPKKVTIGFIPTNNPVDMKKEFEPVRKYLEKEMGIKIEVKIADNYLSLINDMKKNKVDIGWFGAFSYVTAEKELELDPLVLRYKKESGTSYKSLIITHKDSGIKTLEDLKGKSFTFVDPASTSGFIIPYGLFKSRDIDIENYFENITYAGTHENVGRAVLNRSVDAGTISSTMLSKLIEDKSIHPETIRIIWKSDEIPGSPYVARMDLSPELKQSFQKAMLNIHAKEPQALIAYDKSIEKFVVFDKSLYNGVRNTARILNKDNMFEQLLQKE